MRLFLLLVLPSALVLGCAGPTEKDRAEAPPPKLEVPARVKAP